MTDPTDWLDPFADDADEGCDFPDNEVIVPVPVPQGQCPHGVALPLECDLRYPF